MIKLNYVYRTLKQNDLNYKSLHKGLEWFVIETTMHEFHMSKSRFIFKEYAAEEHECTINEFIENGIPGLEDTLYSKMFRNSWEPTLKGIAQKILEEPQ